MSLGKGKNNGKDFIFFSLFMERKEGKLKEENGRARKGSLRSGKIL